MMGCHYQTIVVYIKLPKESHVVASGIFYPNFASASLCKLRCSSKLRMIPGYRIIHRQMWNIWNFQWWKFCMMIEYQSKKVKLIYGIFKKSVIPFLNFLQSLCPSFHLSGANKFYIFSIFWEPALKIFSHILHNEERQ